MRFAFISAEKALYPVLVLCSALGVTACGYYAWLKRPKSSHAKRDEDLRVKVRAIHEESGKRYGEPRISEALKAEIHTTGARRTLMVESGWRGWPEARKGGHLPHVRTSAAKVLWSRLAKSPPWAHELVYVRMPKWRSFNIRARAGTA